MREELPAFAVVLRLVAAARAHAKEDALRVVRVDVHRVDAGIAAAGAVPVLAVRVPVDPFHGAPRLSPVLAAEQPRRLRSGEDHAGLALVAGRDVPDVSDHP